MFEVVTDIGNLPRDIQKWDKNRRFATAVGITWTGQDVKKGLRKEMQSVFDRPTRWTLNSLFLKPAKRDDWNGLVFFKDFAPKGTAAGAYLDPQISGGDRKLKRSERLFRRRGFLASGLYLVPGRDARLNAAGNIPKGQITKALSDVGAQWDPRQNTSRKRGKYFWLPAAGRRLAGVYWKQGGQLKSLLVAVRAPIYRRRFDFYATARTISRKRLTKNIRKAINRFTR